MSAYSDAVKALSPTAYWRLGEASGVTAYDETTNHDGTYVNTPTLGEPSLIDSDTANAAVLFASASSEHVDVPDDTALDLGATFTIIARVKFISGTSYATIVGKYEAAIAKGYMFLVNYGGDYKARLWTKNGSTTHLAGTTAINDGNVHMIVATLSGGTGKIYVDGGAAENSGSLTTPGANAEPLVIADTGGARAFNGTADEVMVLKGAALSQAQIQNLCDIATAARTTFYATPNCTMTFGYNPTTMKLLYVECPGPPSGYKTNFKAVELAGDTWEDSFAAEGSKLCPYDMVYVDDGEGGIKNIDISVQMERI